ncbi:MAG: hypothetical protein WCD89_21670, partial [Anaerocolumna sp.]
DNYNAITWEDVKSSIPGAVDSFFQPFRTVFNKENAYNFFLNPDTTDEQLEEYATNGIAAGLTVYGLGKGLQGISPKISVTNTMRPIINANGTMQLATASAPTISVVADGGLLGNLAYSAAGTLGGSNYNGSNKGMGENLKTNGHHSDPKYLGGDPGQKLTDIEVGDHIDIHKQIDVKYPRYKGKSYYEKIKTTDPEFNNKINKDLSDIYNKYKEKYPD